MEFVLVAPLIILIYLGAVELSMGLEVDKNVSRASGIIADIVAQQPSVSKAQLEDIAKIGAATLYPYDRDTDGAGIRITAIQVEQKKNNPAATVSWSYGEGGLTADTKGAGIDIPVPLHAPGAFLIKVDVALSYVPITTWGLRNIASTTGALPLSETYYLGPRLSNAIACSNC
ncbi:TadE/TadG family type IV pilus assembly protein [Phyllobacterium leguminum]|uniref:TadE/TadG family type IV pilus assembly protein n=1 Tax=Phyllobacterium leguminum TaxID=314237 RepID=UPI0015E8A6CC|nr:TadE/TadG family type IV pilus assembly protein [Phyllobacterium leguminum]